MAAVLAEPDHSESVWAEHETFAAYSIRQRESSRRLGAGA